MKPYLFLHIPRTGGTSIASVLPDGYSSVAEIRELISRGKKDDNEVSQQHTILENYPIIKNELFKFTFVRNPWDRMVSIFEHQLSYGMTYEDEMEDDGKIVDVTCKTHKFQRFLIYLVDLWKAQTLHFKQDGHYCPQIFFTHDNNFNQSVNYIGRFETMHEDLRKLNEICDFGIDLNDLPHKNCSKKRKKNYRDYYNAEIDPVLKTHPHWQQINRTPKDIVGALYHEEIELFGYEF